MTTRTMSAALRYLFAALEHAQNASERVRTMVKVAIGRFLDMAGALARVAAVARATA